VATKEEAVKPDKPIVRRYLGEADYPAKQQELVSKAVGNGAPAAFVERLRNLPKDAEFSGPDEVAEALEHQDESYEERARSRRGSF
jgi:hypothetical protein